MTTSFESLLYFIFRKFIEKKRAFLFEICKIFGVLEISGGKRGGFNHRLMWNLRSADQTTPPFNFRVSFSSNPLPIFRLFLEKSAQSFSIHCSGRIPRSDAELSKHFFSPPTWKYKRGLQPLGPCRNRGDRQLYYPFFLIQDNGDSSGDKLAECVRNFLFFSKWLTRSFRVAVICAPPAGIFPWDSEIRRVKRIWFLRW